MIFPVCTIFSIVSSSLIISTFTTFCLQRLRYPGYFHGAPQAFSPHHSYYSPDRILQYYWLHGCSGQPWDWLQESCQLCIYSHSYWWGHSRSSDIWTNRGYQRKGMMSSLIITVAFVNNTAENNFIASYSSQRSSIRSDRTYRLDRPVSDYRRSFYCNNCALPVILCETFLYRVLFLGWTIIPMKAIFIFIQLLLC